MVFPFIDKNSLIKPSWFFKNSHCYILLWKNNRGSPPRLPTLENFPERNFVSKSVFRLPSWHFEKHKAHANFVFQSLSKLKNRNWPLIFVFVGAGKRVAFAFEGEKTSDLITWSAVVGQ